MIPVMVARDSVTAEQGILVTSSSSSFFPFLFFTDFLSKFHSDQALHSPHTTPLQVIDIEEQIVVVVLQTIEHPWKSESGNRSRTIQNELVQMRKLSIQWPNLITRYMKRKRGRRRGPILNDRRPSGCPILRDTHYYHSLLRQRH